MNYACIVCIKLRDSLNLLKYRTSNIIIYTTKYICFTAVDDTCPVVVISWDCAVIIKSSKSYRQRFFVFIQTRAQYGVPPSLFIT